MTRTKFNQKGTVIDGYKFASQKEGLRYNELKYLQMAGEIYGLSVHPVFILLPHFRDSYSGECQKTVTYTADFMYQHKDNHFICEDVKSTEKLQTVHFRIKWKWVKFLNKEIEFRIVTNVRGAR